MSSSKDRVYVTGLGAVSPLGCDVEQTWRNLIAGVSGADYIKSFDASHWPIKFGCEVKGMEQSAASEFGLPGRAISFGMKAVNEALENSGLNRKDLANPRCALSLGTSISSIDPSLANHFLGEKCDLSSSAQTAHLLGRHGLLNHPGALGGLLAQEYQIRGGTRTFHSACASSGQAIGHGFRQIKRGQADVVICLGADSLMAELMLSGFCLIGALSQRNDDPTGASRPFDRDRDGFVAGEGAAAMILESERNVLRREASVVAEVAGYGETASAYRITDLPENGRGIVEAMQGALEESGLSEQEVGYINAHGTSTQLNDRVEALAIRRVFGSRGARPKISSTKSQTGHLIAGAGAMEALFSILAIDRGVIPYNLNLNESDCGDDINFVQEESVRADIFASVSNSIGFGGTNTSLIFKKATN